MLAYVANPANNPDWRPLYPFLSRWLALPQGRLHYIDEGPTKAKATEIRDRFLFVHGNPTWSFHWRRLIAELRTDFRCVALDHLGCGLSDKPTQFLSLKQHIDNLVALIDQLQLDRITLVAQDWGGAIGLGAMLQVPDLVNRIILFNSGAFTPNYIPWRIRACRLPIFGRLAVQGANLFSLAALRMTLARHRQLEPAVAAGYLAPYSDWANRRAVYGFVRDIPTGPAHPTWNTLNEIERRLPEFANRPIALIWGMKDWCFRPDCLDRFLAAWPQAETHRLPDVGHWVVEDAPEIALPIVRSFWRSTNEPSLDEPPNTTAEFDPQAKTY